MTANSQQFEYALVAELKGSKGAINALLFSDDGKHLLSAGDDQSVRVWCTETFNLEQILHFERWGQVTCLSWVAQDRVAAERRMALSVGSARGGISICPLSLDPFWLQWKEVAHVFEFPQNDAIEKQAYDPLNSRLVAGSHAGTIKMFSLEGFNLHCLWTVSTNYAVPRALAFFGGANQSVLILTLGSGEMSSRDAQSSQLHWTKHLHSAVGNAVLSPDEAMLIVDNVTSGKFDLYAFPSSTPLFTLALESTRHFVKECAFVGGDKVVACGGHRGRVELVDTASGSGIHTLSTASESSIIRTIATASRLSDEFLVAGGATNASPRVYLWMKRPIRPPLPAQPNRCIHLWQQNKIAICLVMLTVLVNYDALSLLLRRLSQTTLVCLVQGLSTVHRAIDSALSPQDSLDNIITVSLELPQSDTHDSLDNIITVSLELPQPDTHDSGTASFSLLPAAVSHDGLDPCSYICTDMDSTLCFASRIPYCSST